MLARRINEHEYRGVATLYIATPERLTYVGIEPASVDPQTDILTSANISLDHGLLRLGRKPITSPQSISPPAYASAPTSLITASGRRRAALVATRAGWLVETDKPLTSAQQSASRTMAAAAGLNVETRNNQSGLGTIRVGATAAAFSSRCTYSPRPWD